MYLSNFFEFQIYIEKLSFKLTEELMIFVGDESAIEMDKLISFLNVKGIKFFGGIYPGLLYKEKCYHEGFIVEKVEPIFSSMVLPYMMRFKQDLNLLENFTALIIVDGLSSKMKALTDTVQNKLGNRVKYIGGGAGFYNLEHKPCVFNNNGLFEDVLHICILKSDVCLAVKHGWSKLEGPYEITEANGNILSKLGNYNAYEVYRDVVEEHENIRLSSEDFFHYAKDYPFGIAKKSQLSFVVRDPISVTGNNEIVCVADIPEDNELFILKGDVNSLLSSSMQIAESCASQAPDEYLPLLFDCISRAMFMKDRFGEELFNVQSKLSHNVEGALSIGEISSLKSGELIIHNKSTILGLLEKNNF